MPSPYDVLQLDCFSVVPLYIPNWFVLALCYWHAEYNRDLFMALRSTPFKFCLHRCGSLWLDLERVWPEAYGDDSINDIDALDRAGLCTAARTGAWAPSNVQRVIF